MVDYKYQWVWPSAVLWISSEKLPEILFKLEKEFLVVMEGIQIWVSIKYFSFVIIVWPPAVLWKLFAQSEPADSGGFEL